MTQCERILQYLNDEGSITTMQAFTELGITRLASRIHDLYEKGYDFERENIKVKTRYGDTTVVTKYSLKGISKDDIN